MPNNPDLSRTPDYNAARAVEERRLAMASSDPKVRAIHLELAERYARLAESGEIEPPQPVPDQQQRV